MRPIVRSGPEADDRITAARVGQLTEACIVCGEQPRRREMTYAARADVQSLGLLAEPSLRDLRHIPGEDGSANRPRD
jgi:hypothetical protein